MYAPQQIAREIDDRSSLPIILLAAWIVATAALGPNFYVIRFAGFVDITIERILFVIMVAFLVVGLFQGKAIIQKNIAIELFMGVFALICLVSMTQTGFLPITPEFISPWFVFIAGYFFPFIIFSLPLLSQGKIKLLDELIELKLK